MKMIGIDIGTTTVSGVVLEKTREEEIKILETKTIDNGCFIKTKKEWERIQDAEKLVEKAKELLDFFLERYPDAEQIGLTGQMHGIVYLDRNGKSVSPLYTWQDERGNVCEEGQECSLTEELFEKCGIKTASGYGLVTHIYNRRHGMIPEAASGFCTIMDYFGMKLTGRRTPLVHVSNAASLGFFDGEKMEFNTKKLGYMGVTKDWLPTVCKEIKKLGSYKNCIVTTAIGDNQASFLGSVGNREQTLLINMGTGGQISVLSEQYFSEDGIEARPFLDGKYLLVGASLCGGKAYALLKQFFEQFLKTVGGQSDSLYAVLEQLARSGKILNKNRKENRKLKVETTFDGTRLNPEMGGSITNLFSENFTPEEVTYGVLEGMSQELYKMYQLIQNQTGIKIETAIGSGNGLRKNPVLCEIIEEMFGVELILAGCEEEAATGAAISSDFS